MEGPTTDPFLNKQLSITDSILGQTAPQNQYVKDKTWSPPFNQQDLMDTCITQANKLGVDVNKHCNGLLYHCNQISLTSQECYALNFVSPTVNVPEKIGNSLQTKLNAANMAADRAATIMGEWSEREKESLKSTACMPYCD